MLSDMVPLWSGELCSAKQVSRFRNHLSIDAIVVRICDTRKELLLGISATSVGQCDPGSVFALRSVLIHRTPLTVIRPCVASNIFGQPN